MDPITGLLLLGLGFALFGRKRKPGPPKGWTAPPWAEVTKECDALDPSSWGPGKVCVNRGDRWIELAEGEQAEGWPCLRFYRGYCIAIEMRNLWFTVEVRFVVSEPDGTLVARSHIFGAKNENAAEDKAVHKAYIFVDTLKFVGQ